MPKTTTAAPQGRRLRVSGFPKAVRLTVCDNREVNTAGGMVKDSVCACRRLSKSGFNCLSKSGQVLEIILAA